MISDLRCLPQLSDSPIHRPQRELLQSRIAELKKEITLHKPLSPQLSTAVAALDRAKARLAKARAARAEAPAAVDKEEAAVSELHRQAMASSAGDYVNDGLGKLNTATSST